MKNKIKLVLSIALIIASLATIFKSFIGGVLILLAGLVIYPKISEKLFETIPIWKNRAVRMITPILLFIFGASINAIQNKDEIALDRKEAVVIQYIKQNADTDKSLSNLKLLAEIGSLFNNGNYALSAPSSHLQSKTDTITKITTFTLNPVYDFQTAIKIKYLKPDDEKGNILDYQLIFEVDKGSTIASKKTIIEYANTGKEEYLNQSVPEFSKFLNQEVVNNQKEKLAIEEQNRKDREAYNKRAENFEDDCLNPWDGSHILFSRMIKEQSNNPDSFEHVKTTFRLFKGYAIVNMTFRGTNKFGAIVTNKLSAKVSLEDCTVTEIFE